MVLAEPWGGPFSRYAELPAAWEAEYSSDFISHTNPSLKLKKIDF